MCPTYYVFIPGTDKAPTAEVEAPDARHARTAYLDQLTRSGLAPYSMRGQLRKLVKVTKVEPGEVRTALKLSYGEHEIPEQEIGSPEEGSSPTSPSEISRSFSGAVPVRRFVRVLPAQQQANIQAQSQPAGQETIRQRLSPVVKQNPNLSPAIRVSRMTGGR